MVTVESEMKRLEKLLSKEKRLFKRIYDKLDKHTQAFDRLVRFRKRLEKDIEYYVRDMQKTKLTSASDRELNVIRKKIENY